MLRAALIGFPATGKTTLFQLMTAGREAPRSLRGDVLVGASRVPDERLDRLTALIQPRKRVPATVEVADLAATGRTGAQALLDVAPFRNADALLHVVRSFRDPAVPHVAGAIDPPRDARAMEDELILADLGVVERRLERLARDLKKGAGGGDLRQAEDLLARCRIALEEGTPLRVIPLAGADVKRLRGFQFLSAKPLLLVINVDEADVGAMERAAAAAGLETFLARAGARWVAVCGRIELEIAQLEPDEARVFLADLGVRESGLDRVIRASYELLGYVSFFTTGDEECRAWSIPRGTTAHAAAGEVHTDMARGFIRGEVVRYEDLIARGSLAACRQHGEVRLEGKDYVVQDGDVILFRFAT